MRPFRSFLATEPMMSYQPHLLSVEAGKHKGKLGAACKLAFLMEAKSEDACAYQISAHDKDLRVLKINLEPSNKAHLTACVASACLP